MVQMVFEWDVVHELPSNKKHTNNSGKIMSTGLVDIVEMIQSLDQAIKEAGGGGLTSGQLNWTVKELISHLAPNKVRFNYVGDLATPNNSAQSTLPHRDL